MERVNEKELKFRNGDSGPKYLFRGPHFEWGVLVLKPGEKLGGHYHAGVEETFYLEQGEAVMIVNGREVPAAAGDVLKLAPGETHDIVNRSAGNARFIFIKAPYKPDDKINV
jgi:mannose-6-phosphate isomerase-like protein (cupin superfamily)